MWSSIEQPARPAASAAKMVSAARSALSPLPRLEIGRDRQAGRRRHVAAMVDHRLECHRAVGQAARKGKAGAGRRQRLEAEGGEQLRRADIPGIGHDEGRGMQVAKDLALVHGCSPQSVQTREADSIPPARAGQTNAIGSEAFGVLSCQSIERVGILDVAQGCLVPVVGDGNIVRRSLRRRLVAAFAARHRGVCHGDLDGGIGLPAQAPGRPRSACACRRTGSRRTCRSCRSVRTCRCAPGSAA